MSDFTELHGPRLAEMLILADELSLMHEPDITVTTNPYEVLAARRLSAEVQRLETIEEVETAAETTRANTTLLTLAAIAKVSMIPAFARDITSNNEDEIDAEAQGQFEAFLTSTAEEIDQGGYSYNTFKFVDQEAELLIRVSVAKIVGKTALLHASSIEIETKDDAVRTEMTIYSLPMDRVGTTAFDVRQLVEPVIDKELEAATELFIEDDNNGMSIILRLFFAELHGQPDKEFDVDLAKLIDSYVGTDKLEALRSVIAAIQKKGSDARHSVQLASQFEGINLPSSDELAAYHALLSDLRS